MDKIKWKTIQAGQVRPYADSIYEYAVESDLSKVTVERFCKTFLKPSKNKGSTFNGSCNFPFGMESFYRFKETGESRYNYIVCCPYTG